MSVVNITNINVLDTPSTVFAPLSFEITFECISPLEKDLEFKLVYVGSAEDKKFDQDLDCILVGPVPVGVNKFVFTANAPNYELIPSSEIIGVTVVLLICSYDDQEFVRVGYFVDTDYASEEMRQNPPETSKVDLNLLTRTIKREKPRVTMFPIKWDSFDANELPPANEEIPEHNVNYEYADESEEDDEVDCDSEDFSETLTSEGDDDSRLASMVTTEQMSL